jgi:hypothetical protein
MEVASQQKILTSVERFTRAFFVDAYWTTACSFLTTMKYTQLGHTSLTDEALREVEMIMKDAVPTGGRSPEAM